MANIDRATIGGACYITLGGVDLGHTLDGVEFEAQRELTDITVDQYGTTPIDKVLTGTTLTIKTKLAEAQADNLNVVLPESEYAQAGTGASLKERVGLGADAGYSLRSESKQLVIHPLKNAVTDLSEDITIYKAVSAEAVPTAYKVDEQRVWEVTFIALLDESKPAGRRLGHFGYANIS